MNRLPRISPFLYDRNALLLYALNIAGVVANGWCAYRNRGGEWLLALNCLGLAVSIWCCVRAAMTVYREIQDWEDIKRTRAEVDQIMSEREHHE